MAEVTRRRRVATPEAKRKTLAEEKKYREELNTLAKDMAKEYNAIEQAQNRILALQVEARAVMDTHALKLFPTEFGTHRVEAKKGKAQRTIDIEKFEKLVSKEQFMDSIEVSVTKANQILAKATVDSISHWKEGKVGPEVYEFLRKK